LYDSVNASEGRGRARESLRSCLRLSALLSLAAACGGGGGSAGPQPESPKNQAGDEQAREAKSSSAIVWVTSLPEKIAANAHAPSTPQKTAQISAARNEFESFQIVVSGAASEVRAEVTTPLSRTDPITGKTDVITDVSLYQEALINITRASSPDGAVGRLPDALVPAVDEIYKERRNAFPFEVHSGESRAIWVEVFVPETAAPGDYQGEITVRLGKEPELIPIGLTVWGFALPSTSSVRSAFGLWYGGLPAGHGISSSDYDTFATLRAKYGQLALDHRITLSHHDDGLFNDFGHFGTYFGPLAEGTANTRLEGARLTAIEYLGGLTDTSNMSRWAQHYRERGWFDRLFQYTCDEPGYQGCDWVDTRARTAAAKKADPEFRTLVTATIQEAAANGVTENLDLVVPVVNYVDDKSGRYEGSQRLKAPDPYEAFLSSDPLNELWMYQSCMSHGCGGGNSTYFTGWPSYMIDASAVRNRAMQWLLFRYGATGELYWDTTYAYSHGDPWTDQWGFDGNGDGTLFYPGTPAQIGGTTHIPVASIRLKMIREGMEDYEYLKLAFERSPWRAMQIADTLFPNAYSTEATPEAVMAARRDLANLILTGTP
jgi:hypothetical protein